MAGAALSGAREMRQKLLRFMAKFPDEVARALYMETEIEVKEVKRRTPVDQGTLRGTVMQIGPIRNATHIYTYIVAGGPAAPYAIYVHENPDAFHKVGQWKFIESVVMESKSYIGERIARRVQLNRVL